jgi:dipeptidyl aminopeptidase/acylaminoacyl peptidase
MRMKVLFLVSVMIAAVLFSCCENKKETPAQLIDMKLFFKNGDKELFFISPNGKYYSFLASYKGKMNIFVRGVDDTTSVRVTNDTVRSIYRYFWKGDRIMYLQDEGGNENYHLFSVSNSGDDLKNLTPFEGSRCEMVDALRNIPGKEKHIIVALNKRNKECFDPYLLNVETGELTLLYNNIENFLEWKTDNNGVIRLALRPEGQYDVWYYRKAENEPFQVMQKTSYRDSFTPKSFNSENLLIYALSNLERDKVALVEYDPETKSEVKILFSNDNYDLQGITYDRKKQKLMSVYWNAERSMEHFFDDEWGSIYHEFKSRFADDDLFIISHDDESSKAIVFVYSDRNPGIYYLYDFAAKTISEASNPYSWIDQSEMARVKPVSYSSRDGLTIHGYLTLPKGVKAQKLPLIVYPHGGPWSRDLWFFNPEIQFLANRGYAVFQMNFRGSTGYGKKFTEAGFKEWGRKMQDDITEGVNWLIKKGVADKERIGIYGASYGGYATLAGVAFTPDLYAAAVDYVGISNLFTFMNTIPPYWKPYLEQFYLMIGDPVKDSLLFRSTSPVFHADRIKTPLFIVQGANDPRVNKAESDQMVEALKARGVAVKYMVKEDEGHGFLNQDNLFDFYGEMELFLNQYLKPKEE